MQKFSSRACLHVKKCFSSEFEGKQLGKIYIGTFWVRLSGSPVSTESFTLFGVGNIFSRPFGHVHTFRFFFPIY